jgi:hypothetical protein
MPPPTARREDVAAVERVRNLPDAGSAVSPHVRHDGPQVLCVALRLRLDRRPGFGIARLLAPERASAVGIAELDA